MSSRRSRRFVLLRRRPFGTLDLWRRKVRRPGHARLRLVIAQLDDRRRGRDDDEMVAAGALDLSAGEFAVALNVLLAMRAGEFEFAHKPGGQSTSHSPRTFL